MLRLVVVVVGISSGHLVWLLSLIGTIVAIVIVNWCESIIIIKTCLLRTILRKESKREAQNLVKSSFLPSAPFCSCYCFDGTGLFVVAAAKLCFERVSVTWNYYCCYLGLGQSKGRHLEGCRYFDGQGWHRRYCRVPRTRCRQHVLHRYGYHL